MNHNLCTNVNIKFWNAEGIRKSGVNLRTKVLTTLNSRIELKFSLTYLNNDLHQYDVLMFHQTILVVTIQYQVNQQKRTAIT